MKKELDPADIPPVSNLKIVPETELLEAPYFHLKNEFTGIMNFNTLTTPFLVYPLDHEFNRALKRAVDILLSTVCILAILSWLIPLIALFIKLTSRGPVFFLQKRNKRNGELFTCIKFRSMYKNAQADILPAGKNDDRITPLGWFLRNHYLDELPQLFNVLWGDMSIIGPRPHMISENVKFDGLIKNYGYRNKVKPGITGLAQVMGYVGETDDVTKMKNRVNMDIFYVRHWSAKMDIAILLRTLTKATGSSS